MEAGVGAVHRHSPSQEPGLKILFLINATCVASDNLRRHFINTDEGFAHPACVNEAGLLSDLFQGVATALQQQAGRVEA